jgi:Ca-activated chloride channel family protein
VTYVQPGENLELVLTDFYRRIARPVLTDLAIEFEGMAVDAPHPATLPDMFEGSSLLLSGRYRATTEDGEVTVYVRGRSGEQARSFSYTFDLAETGDHAFVPRLWATRQIGLLLDTVRVEGETDALVEKIRGLGLTYGLVTPYTTFVIAAQTNGVASADNMALYSRGAELNRASGETTIQARVQNQSYQQAAQANLATGANVVNSGHRNLARVSTQQIDLMLLQGKRDLAAPLDDAWIADNIEIDRQIAFGSEAYFELAGDPQARAFLQAGNNVTFAYQGAVIQVEDPDAPATSFDLQAHNGAAQAPQGDPLPFDNRAPQVPQQPALTGPVSVIQALMDAVWDFVRALPRVVPWQSLEGR